MCGIRYGSHKYQQISDYPKYRPTSKLGHVRNRIAYFHAQTFPLLNQFFKLIQNALYLGECFSILCITRSFSHLTFFFTWPFPCPWTSALCCLGVSFIFCSPTSADTALLCVFNSETACTYWQWVLFSEIHWMTSVRDLCCYMIKIRVPYLGKKCLWNEHATCWFSDSVILWRLSHLGQMQFTVLCISHQPLEFVL